MNIRKYLPFKIEKNGLFPKIDIGFAKIRYQKIWLWKIPILVPFFMEVIETPAIKYKRKNYKLKTYLEDKNFKKKYLEKIYRKRVGRHPNIDNPKTLTEKINYLKLNCEDDRIKQCCDKYSVKEYIKKIIGEKYCIPNINTWKNVDEIDFDLLPNQFVLKVNWSSGYNIIVTDKRLISSAERNSIKKQIKIWVKPESNSYWDSFNWGYKNMLPVIYAEKYLQINDDEYKIFCFNGRAIFALIEQFDSNNKNYRLCIDRNGNELGFTIGNYPKAITKISSNYEKMILLAEKLSNNFKFVRVDFIQSEKELYVGEMTFYSGGGFSKFNPSIWDEKLGKMLKL